MSISCKNAELQQFCVVMSTIWVLKVENDERTIGHSWIHVAFFVFQKNHIATTLIMVMQKFSI